RRRRSCRSTTTRITSGSTSGSRRRTERSRTPPASASVSNGSHWRCSARTGSTRWAGPQRCASTSGWSGTPDVPALLGLDPKTYRAHQLHSPERQFPETNCYTALWIELLHAQGFEPLAMLAYCVTVDFEGDQWTFFKPPPEDLARLYGLEVQEFVVYRPLPKHVLEQLELGRTVIVEADAFYLPDTAGR